MNSCCGVDADPGEKPGYRRALMIAIALNLGFGLVETVGGFLADSQALKADALDFLGDGSITLIGLLALAWASNMRAKVALAQGLFLGALGIGVMGFAIYRAFNASLPEAELMGGIGVAALAVNIAAALVLMPFRKVGDAQARAIWLFSRNDAIANLVVIGAAVLVGWTKSAWPDLVVAGGIALLFLHSATEIIRDSRRTLIEGVAPRRSTCAGT